MVRWCNKCPSKACICAVLSVVLFFAVCTVITCGFVYLKPFLQVVRYQDTSCRVESSFYTTQFVCSCGRGCSSTYPCYLVHVSLNTSKGEHWIVTLYQDDTQQSSILSMDNDKQQRCSLRSCLPSAEENRRKVMRFEEKYGVKGSVLRCLYDPLDVRMGAVLKVVLPGMQVFHAMLWPLVIIVVDIIICVIFCKRCRRNEENSEGKEKEAGSAIETKPLTVAEDGETKGPGASGSDDKGKGKIKKGKGKSKNKNKDKDKACKEKDKNSADKKTKSLWI